MEMHQIQYFLAVSEYLNFHQAEFQPHISMQCEDLGINIPVVYRSEKEDWIQIMWPLGSV
jgi:hypothetical protein